MKMPSFPTFRKMKPNALVPYLRNDEARIQSLIYTQQFSRELIDRLVRCAEKCRSLMADRGGRRLLRESLADKAVSLYFPQASTRTFTSFSFAAQALGMMVEEIRDAGSSSISKGESEIDTLLTLASVSDTIVMRQMDHELILMLAYEIGLRGLDTRVVNGGSGSDQHPTQALLEIYTLLHHFRQTASEFGEEERTVAFVGDLKRSRTARSLSYLLALYPKIQQVFIAPEELQMGDDLQEYLRENDVQFSLTNELNDLVPKADAFYLMRIQDEYSTTSEELRREYQRYYLTAEKVKQMKETACILHPLPRRDEIPIEIDRNHRAKYWDAVSHGKLMRMALLLYMYGRDDISGQP